LFTGTAQNLPICQFIREVIGYVQFFLADVPESICNLLENTPGICPLPGVISGEVFYHSPVLFFFQLSIPK
jgi:hypothetical protein